MKKTLTLAITCALLSTSALALTSAEEKAEKNRINTQYKSEKAQCKSLKGNPKDVCEEEAEGRQKIALAELDFKKEPTPANRYKVEKTKADAAYEVADEKCDALKGNEKDVCEKDAKASHVKALEAAKVAEVRNEPEKNPNAKAADVAEARKDANEKIREADYEAAKQRCDALSGDAKSACVDDAKRKFAQ